MKSEIKTARIQSLLADMFFTTMELGIISLLIGLIYLITCAIKI